MTKLDRLYNRLQRDGFTVSRNTLYNVGTTRATAPVIIVNTDYNGMYPDAETNRKHAAIRKLCGQRFKVESRGYYTAVFIREWLSTE